jgi:hypothetical protein
MGIIALAIAGILLYSLFDSKAQKLQPIRIKAERKDDRRRR